MWEAQFGDFANGAQIIIDQFICSAETKWLRPSALVMLLPHGYEGQGPEHSSARLERFLQLCAEENMEVCNLTTPAQYFHVLRRQMLREFRKPLIIMTPKSLLRSEAAVSTTEDFTKGSFHEILEGPKPADASKVERLILCSGKVYYDLQAYREKNGWSDRSAIVRLEQIYPPQRGGASQGHRSLRRGQGNPLVSGRAPEHGLLASPPPPPHGSLRPQDRLRRPRGQRQHGCRHHRRAQGPAGRPHCAGLR